MADTKISDLTEKISLVDDDIFLIVDSEEALAVNENKIVKPNTMGNKLFSDKTTDDLTEGSNLYYTDARVSANSDVVANTAKVGVTTEISNLVEDTTPQLGGNLDAQNNKILNLNSADFDLIANGNSGASSTIDLDSGAIQTITIDQTTTLTISATQIGKTSLIISGGESFAVTWSGVTWLTSGGTAPTLDGNDLITFLNDGTTIWGVISNQS